MQPPSSNHFTCHPRRTTSDSLHYVITFVKNALRKEVVSALFLNIKGTFPNVVLSQLIHNMRNWGVLSQYTDFNCMQGEWKTDDGTNLMIQVRALNHD